jgi:hypothetical protein
VGMSTSFFEESFCKKIKIRIMLFKNVSYRRCEIVKNMGQKKKCEGGLRVVHVS